MAALKAVHKSDWKDGFLFVGNEPVLDFLNTRPVQNGEPLELVPDFAALVRWFQAADLLTSGEVKRLRTDWDGTSSAKQTVSAVHALREKLRSDLLAWEQGGAIRRATVDELNQLLAEHPMRSRLITRGKSYATELWFRSRAPQDLFAPIAYSSAHLFADADPKRVRKCENCVLHFHDTSKKGTRRWCSMQLCGNRLKVAAYAARQAELRRSGRD